MRNKRITLSLYSRKDLGWLVVMVFALGMLAGIVVSCWVYTGGMG